MSDDQNSKTGLKDPKPTRRQIMEAARTLAPLKDPALPSAARSQDFLYDEDGLPR